VPQGNILAMSDEMVRDNFIVRIMWNNNLNRVETCFSPLPIPSPSLLCNEVLSNEELELLLNDNSSILL
jgi:hypothetical protein